MTIWNYSLELCYISTALLFSLSALFVPHSNCVPMAPLPTEVISIEVPKGTRLQGSNPQVLCTPSKWTDVATFLLANYVAHAATLKSLPGESILSALKNIVLSLIFPISGVKRGLNAIFQFAIFAKTPLEVAAKANALCMVIRAPDWKPERGDVVEMTELRKPSWTPWEREDGNSHTRAKRFVAGVMRIIMKLSHFFSRVNTLMRLERPEDEEISNVPVYMVQPDKISPVGMSEVLSFQPSSSSWDLSCRTVHGVCQLPPGYTLCTIPPGSQIVELDRDQQGSEDQLDKDQPGGRERRGNKDKSYNREDKAIAASLYLQLKSKVSSERASRQSSLHDIRPSITQLSSNKNFAKGLIAIFQTFYASFTLYQARGDQIQRYGYAAFGLTVVPYLIMSIVNLASNVLTPDYSVMYLVGSDAMEEAKKRANSKFEGVVGRILKKRISNEFTETIEFDFNSDGKMVLLKPGSDADSIKWCEEAEMIVTKQRHDPWTAAVSAIPSRRPYRMIARSNGIPSTNSSYRTTLKLCVMMALGLIPLAVNGALSHFKPYQSTVAQRVWTMTWLALGIASSGASNAPLGIAVYMAPAIGGFVVVCQMIIQYGNCVKLT